jgi:hypothetical protein
MTPDDFRKIALGLAGAEERSHMRHPDFRVHGKIFASLGSPSPEWGTVKLQPDHQAALVKAHPKTFVPASGAWGRSGWTSVQLSSVDPETLGEALTASWRIVSKA